MKGQFAAVVLLLQSLPILAEPPIDLKKDGAFAFPQKQAAVICDSKELRVSWWNDSRHLYVQAIIWKDDDNSLGETEDGRPIGDTASLTLDLDADQKVTANVDRTYALNSWPAIPGLSYSIELGRGASTHIKQDSKGRGAIRYVGSDPTVRVDSFVIPLDELQKKPGDTIRWAYWASSPKPEMTLNSVGVKRPGKYYSSALPRKDYHEITLISSEATWDITQTVDGKNDKVPLMKKAVKPMPKIGDDAPELTAKDWLNVDNPLTLAELKGKVVLVDFWATWCGPCVKGIPHLNTLHEKHLDRGLIVVGFTEQSKKGIENYMKRTAIKYPLGVGSELAAEYGVRGLPSAFLIGRTGKIVWQGSTIDEDFEKSILAALEAK